LDELQHQHQFEIEKLLNKHSEELQAVSAEKASENEQLQVRVSELTKQLTEALVERAAPIIADSTAILETDISRQIEDLTEQQQKTEQERREVKKELRIWEAQFRDREGREPTPDDKHQLKEKYVLQRTLKAKTNELEKQLKQLAAEQQKHDALASLRAELSTTIQAKLELEQENARISAELTQKQVQFQKQLDSLKQAEQETFARERESLKRQISVSQSKSFSNQTAENTSEVYLFPHDMKC